MIVRLFTLALLSISARRMLSCILIRRYLRATIYRLQNIVLVFKSKENFTKPHFWIFYSVNTICLITHNHIVCRKFRIIRLAYILGKDKQNYRKSIQANEIRIISVFIVTITLWGLIKYIGDPLLSSVIGLIYRMLRIFGRKTAESCGYTNSRWSSYKGRKAISNTNWMT